MSDLNILPADQNRYRAAGFESSSTAGLVMAGQIDEITGRILVDSASGSGTVTSVSVVTANGISGSVATATTTPAITLTLGAITPSQVTTPLITASTSGGLTIESNNGTDIGLFGAGNTANVTWYGSHNYDTATQDTIAAFTGSGKTLGSLATATYPSLTELSYVKGVTSAIQTQFTAKAPLVSPSFTTPSLGVATATSINGLTITTTTGVLTMTNSKTLAVTNTLTLSGTDSTVMTFPSTTQTIAGLTSTQTFTNKRITKRTATTNAPGATPTTNTDNIDLQIFTGLNTAITSMTTNLSGTPSTGDFLRFWLTDDGTARAITWGASFAASGTVALPTTTVISTTLIVGFEWTGSVWRCIAVA
jgi:hypothetical protein